MKSQEMSTEEIIKFNIINQQLDEINNFLKRINEEIKKMKLIINSLKELKKTKEGDEFWAPVVSGIFVKGKILDLEKIRINIGQNIIVERTINEAIELLETQLANLHKEEDNALMQEKQLFDELTNMEEKIRKRNKKEKK